MAPRFGFDEIQLQLYKVFMALRQLRAEAGMLAPHELEALRRFGVELLAWTADELARRAAA